MRFIPNKLKAQQIIYLSGFMATGKSHRGKLLAQRLNYTFIDLDDYIEKLTHCSVTELFATYGETYFRTIEKDCLQRLITAHPTGKIVVALGGGTPCFNQNMDFIRQTGFSIFINTPLSEIYQRLQKEKHKRPLAAHLSDMELLTFIQQLYLQRYRFYAQADMEI